MAAAVAATSHTPVLLREVRIDRLSRLPSVGLTMTFVVYPNMFVDPLPGVVGGVLGLALVAALTFFLIKRRRGSGDPNAILGPSPMAYNPTGDQFYEPPKLYNPADPSTYPTPPSGGDSSNSGGYTTNPYQAGRYNGAAEL